MVINLRELKKPEGVVPTITFSIGYFALITLGFDFLESYFHTKLQFSYLVSFLGAWLILELIWNKYIGKEIKYRKRKIGVPLAIGIIIVIIYLIAVVIAASNRG
jgi:hypothetical protein